MATADVAVFFDFENIFYSVRNTYGLNPNFRAIMDTCEHHGRVILARAYADWMSPDLRQVPHALYANGVEPVYVPTYHRSDDGEAEGGSRQHIKNSVDLHLCIDGMEALFQLPTVEVFVLLTGDRDFIPLVNALKQHGKRVTVIGVQGSTSAHLAQAADEFVYYHELVEEELQDDSAEPTAEAAAAPPVAPWDGASETPIEPPRMGVEIVSTQQQGEKTVYALRDLRSRRIARGVIQGEAHGLWLYAIDQHEQNLPSENEMQWSGDIGLLRAVWRMGRGRYDLVQRDRTGRLHVYYGVTEDGMTGSWAEFIVRGEGEGGWSSRENVGGADSVQPSALTDPASK